MHHTLLIDRTDRGRIDISGQHAVATLNGLVTNDVAALRPGQGQYAAALTAKGKIVADVIVLMLDDRLQLHVSQLALPGLRTMLGKFVNPRFATVTDVTDRTSEFTAIGQDAAAVISQSIDAASPHEDLHEDLHDRLAELPAYSHTRRSIAGVSVMIVRLPAIGASELPVYSVISSRDGAAAVRAALHTAGATDSDASVMEALRIESGVPAWGIDMDDNTLPQEANLDDLHAVSYTKGCYIGQETVARIHFRGHVNRSLRQLLFADDVLPPRGAILQDSEHRAVGDVRSAIRSAALGTIGIGMIRREIEDGAAIPVHWEGGGTTATVAPKAKGAID